MSILAIDTSNETLGVSIYDDHIQKTKIEYTENSKTKHSKRLMPVIDQVMKDASLYPKDLTKIVVAKGPGSYTGVRIGLSTAKMMGWTLNIPVIGVSSLEVLALNGANQSYKICPFFDARRGLVYTGLYESDELGQIRLVKEEQNILFSDWLNQLKKEDQTIIFLSPDVDLHKETIREMLKEKAIIPIEKFHIPSPSLLAISGKNRQGESIHQLTPNYLRLVEAEAKWLAKQKEQDNE
ncbi:tRNA threonylcarbamoyladenosine biosynthesis protein TsaB [Paraliobacillus sp. PM-2]|uniref:tRNA (adenosine(37)-N6)-threonylcarbamoyltransferase complex dimerization subunit type 1 TsaB n=1 Tax=Paraliobacillus sp. PM-2 TaxID=1462524 RepID=UPI00061C9807|nr:tRNA (adenosine(37)-N6)-threonylcarbamoyltransferase complex dimerization subunit type 1 TsaB [Paraliobacillus sp. PM-2]CQR47442.1 tRNA threonylcarbamoyladenosine biosynthesis protein TsaB [Paraliobacillus sp. PM-2]